MVCVSIPRSGNISHTEVGELSPPNSLSAISDHSISITVMSFCCGNTHFVYSSASFWESVAGKATERVRLRSRLTTSSHKVDIRLRFDVYGSNVVLSTIERHNMLILICFERETPCVKTEWERVRMVGFLSRPAWRPSRWDQKVCVRIAGKLIGF